MQFFIVMPDCVRVTGSFFRLGEAKEVAPLQGALSFYFRLLPIFHPDGVFALTLRILGWHAFQSMRIKSVFILLRRGVQVLKEVAFDECQRTEDDQNGKLL